MALFYQRFVAGTWLDQIIVQRNIFGLVSVFAFAYMLHRNKHLARLGNVVEAAKKLPVKRASRKPAAPEPTVQGEAATQPVAPVAKPVAAMADAVKASKSVKPAKATKAVATTKPVEAPKPQEAVATVETVAATVEAAPTPADAIDPIEAVTSPATPSDIITDAPSAPISEGLEDMATSPTQNVGIASEKLQSMFGDVGARFKASFEKSSKLGEEMVELGKGNVEAVVASARVAAKGSEALGQDVAEYGKKSLETAVAAMKSFAAVKSPTELFQLQSDYAKTAFDSAVAEASKFSESMMKLAGDVAQPLSTRYALAAEKIKAAAL